MLNRAYSLVTVKGFDPERRTFSGIATSPVPDRVGDTIDSKGIKYKNPLPLLLYHDSKRPVGETRFSKATADGTPFDAVISSIDRPGIVKDRLDEAVDSLNAKPPLIRGVSIGFRPLETPTYNKETDGYHFSSIEVVELSMVVIPAHQDATIHTLKNFDVGLGVSANEPVVERKPAGVPALSRVKQIRTEHPMKKSFADQIASWEATRAAKSARMDDLLTKDEGVTMDDAEQEEHDTLEGEVKGIDAQLVRLRAALEREKAGAVEVKTAADGTVVRTPQRITVTRELPKGILFARYAMCMGAARGFPGEAKRLALEHYKDDPGVAAMIEVTTKTAVAGGSTTGSHYLDDMVPYSVMNDFIEFLRPGSIVGKFGGPNPGGTGNYPALQRVGFNERVSGMSTGFTSAWVGEGLPTLPSAAVTFNAALLFHKLGAMSILTKEAIRFSNPSAEARVRDDLARSINAKMDLDFVDPAKAAVGATSPASITDSIVATAPSGTAATNVRKDIATLLALFAANNLDASDIVLIMSASMAAQISMMTNTLGNDDFPGLSMKGGTLRGIPVIVSEHLTAVGSPSTQTIIMVKAGDIYLADDGAVTVEASDQASVEMVDTSSQSGITGTGASLVSLWQNGLVGLKATREVTWKRRRTTAVQYISPAAYVAA